MTQETRFDIPELGLYGKTSEEATTALLNEHSYARAVLRQRAAEMTTKAGVQVGAAHNLPPELRPVPRGLPQPARASGYTAPGLLSGVVRVLRRLINPKGSQL